MAGNPLLDVHCASCGAAVQFNIEAQVYNCAFCGAATPTTQAIAEKKGFQALHKEKMQNQPKSFKLQSCTCDNCGAEVVFPESEAMTQCAFCGKSLVRKDYLKTDHFPELLIPFYLTKEEAVTILSHWCETHSSIKEARIVKEHTSELTGMYLPYELARGPVTGRVSRNSSARQFEIRGFIDGVFVNTSKELDNLLLEGMEPFDLSGVREMDFSYLAGGAVKIKDITDQEAEKRIEDEIAFDYEGHLFKPMETRAITVSASTTDMMRMSVLLPVYYMRVDTDKGPVLVAVNGQTGKVAVKERKDRFLLPWWITPILMTLLLTGGFFLLALLISHNVATATLLSAMLGLYFLIVNFALYSDYSSPRFRLRRRVFVSEGGPFVRQNGSLFQQQEALRSNVGAPTFFEEFGGYEYPVKVKFSAVSRMTLMILLAAVAMFLPYILAFILNGFSVSGLGFGGGAVWLCIFVPTAPIYFLKFGRLEIYEKPWFFFTDGAGKSHRVKKKKNKKNAGGARGAGAAGAGVAGVGATGAAAAGGAVGVSTGAQGQYVQGQFAQVKPGQTPNARPGQKPSNAQKSNFGISDVTDQIREVCCSPLVILPIVFLGLLIMCTYLILAWDTI